MVRSLLNGLQKNLNIKIETAVALNSRKQSPYYFKVLYFLVTSSFLFNSSKYATWHC